MKVSGPIVTLAAGALVGATLLGLNLTLRADPEPAASPAAAASSAVSPAPAVSGSAAVSGSPATGATPTAEATPSAPAVAAPKVAYAGRVDGGGPFVALVVQGDRAIAYLCDGKRIEAWMWGTIEGDHLLLQGAKGASPAAWLAAGRGGGRLTGAVVLGSKRWTFALARATAPSGLYRATAQVRGATVVAGWVVLADGEQVGLVTTDGVAAQAPMLDLDSGTALLDGIALTAAPADPSTLTEAGSR
jgi:hypothetical protein